MTTQDAQKLMYALKVSTVSIPIAQTSLGQLCANIRKEEDNWFFTLDSVPVPKNVNEDLKKLFKYE